VKYNFETSQVFIQGDYGSSCCDELLTMVFIQIAVKIISSKRLAGQISLFPSGYREAIVSNRCHYILTALGLRAMLG
jgi:hypothetical protein